MNNKTKWTLLSKLNINLFTFLTDFFSLLAVRRINDKLIHMERYFMDHRGMPNNNFKKHLILSPVENLMTTESEGLFPALMDELDQLMGTVDSKKDVQSSIVRLQKHLPVLVNAIQSAANSLVDEI